MRTFEFLEIVKTYDEEGIIELLHHHNRYIRFTTKIIKDVVGLLGDGFWRGVGNDLIVYEIFNQADCAVMTLYIGPGSKETKEQWIEWAENNQTFKVSKEQK